MQVQTPFQSLMAVRNAKSGPTVFTDLPNGVTIRWEGAGDPSGGDWQHVPEGYVNHPSFADMIRKGVLVVGTAEEAAGAVAVQTAATPGSDLAAQAAASIHRPEVNDFVVIPCIGPGATPTSPACSKDVPVRQSQVGKQAPLCDAHSHLVNEYVPTEMTDGNPGSKPTVVWNRVVMAPTNPTT